MGAMAFSGTSIALCGASLCLSVALAGSCTSSPATTGAIATGGGGGGAGGEEPSYGGKPSWEVMSGSGGCNAVIYEPPVVKSPHVEICSRLEHISNPPTSGPHYPKWANFQSYETPIPWGFLVHSMEHGAVVLAHRCNDCADVAAIQAWVDAQPEDASCISPVTNRLIVAPAPGLDAPFAMAAWGAMLEADCFDPEMAQAFVDAYYAGGPEDICAKGIDPTDPVERIPEGCGE
jgi:hypothetical protein